MRVVGWLLFAATCVLSILQGFLLAAAGESLLSYEVFVDVGFPLLAIGSMVGAAVGALIISRYPRNTIGWLFCIGQLGNAVGMSAQAFAILVAQGRIATPGAGQVALYISKLFNANYTVAFLVVIFMIVPDGTLLSRRWRGAVGLAVVAVLINAVLVVAFPPRIDLPGAPMTYGVLTILLMIVGSIALAGSVVLGAVALWLRLRRATGDRRLQLRWIASSGVALAGAFLLLWLGDVVFSPVPWFVQLPAYLAYIGISVSVGVAILRYRLYDIDVILSRTIVLGVLAVFVTVGYVAVVVVVGSVLGTVKTSVNGLFWPSIVATALVATAFQPLRLHVMSLADRLVYGEQAVPYEALADLSRRLADSPRPDELPGRVAEAVGRAVGAARIRVLLGGPGDDGSTVVAACWPDSETAANQTETVTCPVIDRGEQVGSITVIMPPGRKLRAAECRLVEDFAEQSGLAFRNAMLQAELAARVREVDARSRELAASRRRLVGVEDEERERLAAAIQRQVVPHLAPIANELSADLDLRAPGLAARLDRLIADAEKALDELRIVCRGVFPALLQRRGLVAALSAQLDLTGSPAMLDVDESLDRRLDPAIEGAAYLFCVEVVASAAEAVIRLEVAGDRLVAEVRRGNVARGQGGGGGGRGSGDGGSAAGGFGDGGFGAGVQGAGHYPGPAIAEWQHATDRVDALDGQVTIGDGGSGAVLVRAVIPIDGQRPDRPVAAQTSSSRSGPKADLGT